MDRRTWLTRGFSTLAYGGLAFLGRSAFGLAETTPAKNKTGTAAKKRAGEDVTVEPKARRIPPRLSSDEQRSVAAARAAADELTRTAAEARARGAISGDAFAVALEQSLAVRIHAAEIGRDDAARADALRQHAAVCHEEADRCERQAGIPGDHSSKSDATGARARQAEANARVVAETGEAPQVTKADQRASELALDLLALRLQDARRGATRLDELAEAIHFAVRVVRSADERAARLSDTSPKAVGQIKQTGDSSEKATSEKATPVKVPTVKAQSTKAATGNASSTKPATTKTVSESTAALHRQLAEVRRFLVVRSERAKAARLEVGAQLVEIELARAATLIPEKAKEANDTGPDPRDDAERLSEALFQRLIGERTADKAVGVEQVAAAARLFWRRDEFHQTLGRAKVAVSQIHRNDVTGERRRLEQWSAQTLASTQFASTQRDAARVDGLDAPRLASERAPGHAIDGASNGELRAAVLAQVAAMKALVALRQIDRRLADEIAGKRPGGEPQPAASPYDDLVRPKVLGAADRRSAKD